MSYRAWSCRYSASLPAKRGADRSAIGQAPVCRAGIASGRRAERRKLDPATARKLGDGRVYTGWQAVKNGLVDEVGGEDEAIRWLAKVRNVNPDLPVEDWAPERPDAGFSPFGSRAAAEVLAETVEVLAGKTLQTKRLTLDGLTSVWHADRVER